MIISTSNYCLLKTKNSNLSFTIICNSSPTKCQLMLSKVNFDSIFSRLKTSNLMTFYLPNASRLKHGQLFALKIFICDCIQVNF